MRTLHKRLPGIDIIRFVATMLIFFHHYQQIMDIQFLTVNFDRGKFYFGYLVELFFLISGYVAVFCMGNRSPWDDLFHKIRRIYPMSMVVCTVFIFVVLYYNQRYGISVYDIDLENIIKSELLIYQPNKLAINNPSWYLCVLIQCYLLWEIVRVICRNDVQYKIFVFALIILFSALKWTNAFPGVPFRGYIPFFIGSFMAYMRNDSIYRRAICILAILSACSFILLRGEVFWEYYRWLLVYAYWPVITQIGVNVSVLINRIISEGRSIWGIMAECSWLIYMWHALILDTIKWHFDVKGIDIEAEYGYMIICFVLVFVCALIYIYIRNHCLSLKGE